MAQPDKLWIVPNLELDCKARKIMSSCLAYYGLDGQIMEDNEFDSICKDVVKHWDELSPVRQWLLGSKEDLNATGYHVKVTHMCVDHLATKLIREKKINTGFFHTKDPKFSKKYRISYWNCSDFRLPNDDDEWELFLDINKRTISNWENQVREIRNNVS